MEGAGPIRKPRTGRKARATLLALCLCLIATIAGFLGLYSREPSYQGKSLSYWLSRATKSGVMVYGQENPNAAECRTAIRTIGTNAIPPLLRILRAKDSPIRRAAIGLMERQHYISLPIQSFEEQKDRAQVGFYLLGDLATNAVPALIEIYQHPSSAYSKHIADSTLMRMYPATPVAIPRWVPTGEWAEWYFHMGMVQSQLGASSNALLAFSEAIRLEPTNIMAHLMCGNVKLDIQDFSAAQIDFESAMELSPTNQPAVLGRGLCKFAMKDFKGADADFTTAIGLETNDSTAFNYRGLARANLRTFDAALEDLNKAIEFESYNPSFYRNRASVEGMQTEYEAALADVSKSIELDSKNSMSWVLRSRIQCALKNYQAALADSQKAVQLGSTNSHAYSARATVYMCLNDFDKSAADLEKALQFDPHNPNPFVVRGVLRMKRGGEDDAALADFEHAVELHPQAPETHGMLGWFQYKLAKWEPALANYRKALELGAIVNVAGYHSYIWLIRAQSGQEEAAKQELESYLKSLDATKTNDWSAITARFLTGNLPETNFLSLAITAARRPSAITNQICESLFYAAMKRKLAGDKQGALELLQKCVDTTDDNNMSYFCARDELQALKQH
jgi:tetratricopeptide (TPR) repeat protein